MTTYQGATELLVRQKQLQFNVNLEHISGVTYKKHCIEIFDDLRNVGCGFCGRNICLADYMGGCCSCRLE